MKAHGLMLFLVTHHITCHADQGAHHASHVTHNSGPIGSCIKPESGEANTCQWLLEPFGFSCYKTALQAVRDEQKVCVSSKEWGIWTHDVRRFRPATGGDQFLVSCLTAKTSHASLREFQRVWLLKDPTCRLQVLLSSKAICWYRRSLRMWMTLGWKKELGTFWTNNLHPIANGNVSRACQSLALKRYDD